MLCPFLVFEKLYDFLNFKFKHFCFSCRFQNIYFITQTQLFWLVWVIVTRPSRDCGLLIIVEWKHVFLLTFYSENNLRLIRIYLKGIPVLVDVVNKDIDFITFHLKPQVFLIHPFSHHFDVVTSNDIGVGDFLTAKDTDTGAQHPVIRFGELSTKDDVAVYFDQRSYDR